MQGKWTVVQTCCDYRFWVCFFFRYSDGILELFGQCSILFCLSFSFCYSRCQGDSIDTFLVVALVDNMLNIFCFTLHVKSCFIRHFYIMINYHSNSKICSVFRHDFMNYMLQVKDGQYVKYPICRWCMCDTWPGEFYYCIYLFFLFLIIFLF